MLGGYGKDDKNDRIKLKSCEMFNTVERKWEYIMQLKNFREQFSVCVHFDKIFVFGGFL